MRFVVVDGIDGSGKSTVAGWIAQHYSSRGERVLVQVHPSDRGLGRLARRCLQGDGALMYALSSVLFIFDVLISVAHLPWWRRKYDTVVFVRYLLATAYLPRRYARLAYDLFAAVLPVPERRLVVDVEPQTALHRIAIRQHDREMFENLPSLAHVREKVLFVAADWEVLDNNGPEEDSRRRLDEILARWD